NHCRKPLNPGRIPQRWRDIVIDVPHPATRVHLGIADEFRGRLAGAPNRSGQRAMIGAGTQDVM
ncbi:MAG TPA: hypothetical protein QF901_14110, partial [Gammaproteobacteria bacterium]|nr:hypothetical protein [Gammaproteobacteria bacterium]